MKINFAPPVCLFVKLVKTPIPVLLARQICFSTKANVWENVLLGMLPIRKMYAKHVLLNFVHSVLLSTLATNAILDTT